MAKAMCGRVRYDSSWNRENRCTDCRCCCLLERMSSYIVSALGSFEGLVLDGTRRLLDTSQLASTRQPILLSCPISNNTGQIL